MKRHEFIGLVGGAVASPLVARAQQATMPVVGFLNVESPQAYGPMAAAFRQGLKETGYVDGQTSQSNTAGRRDEANGWGRWRPIWFVVR